MKKSAQSSVKKRSASGTTVRRKRAPKPAQTASEEPRLISRVRAALADVTDVHEKKMFGSTAFLVRGKMCVTARAERIMCRIDPALHAAAVKRKGCKTVVMKGRPYQGFIYVSADALGSARELNHWVKLALDYHGAKT